MFTQYTCTCLWINHPFLIDEYKDKGDTELLLPTNYNLMPPICPVHWALALKSVTKGDGGWGVTCKPWRNRFKMDGI